ncbi:hypothetical protein [Nocardiopsis sp. LOL_012]|uniref:hypothetical protein n=1 Tax=Nocardiopsis sp. LOL_012 TaxID=3345409 RepID=UPI003A8B5034
MKFDLVDPVDGQDPPEEPEGGPVAEEAPLRLGRASASMHHRLRADLAALHSSLNRLGQAVATARNEEREGRTAAAPPRNFRAGAFSGRRS